MFSGPLQVSLFVLVALQLAVSGDACKPCQTNLDGVCCRNTWRRTASIPYSFCENILRADRKKNLLEIDAKDYFPPVPGSKTTRLFRVVSSKALASIDNVFNSTRPGTVFDECVKKGMEEMPNESGDPEVSEEPVALEGSDDNVGPQPTEEPGINDDTEKPSINDDIPRTCPQTPPAPPGSYGGSNLCDFDKYHCRNYIYGLNVCSADLFASIRSAYVKCTGKFLGESGFNPCGYSRRNCLKVEIKKAYKSFITCRKNLNRVVYYPCSIQGCCMDPDVITPF